MLNIPTAPSPQLHTAKSGLSSDLGKILIVEDCPSIRRLISIILERNHYQVVEAEDGLDGAHTALAEEPDLIISDIGMPRMDGVEMCRCLRDNPRTSRIPVIILTGQDAEGARVSSVDAGAADHLRKPVDPTTLLARVQSVLNHRA